MSQLHLKHKNNSLFVSALLLLIFLLSQHNLLAYQKPLRTIKCSTTAAIKKAMDNAKPGDEIIIAKGTYTPKGKYSIKRHITLAPRFYSKKNGTKKNPIIIRGEKASARPILQGPSKKYDGYVFLLEGNYWIIKDLVLRSGSKGLVLDNANNVTINNVEIHDIASEGIHVRDGSSNTTITKCSLHHLGVKNPGNGEGVYIGSDAKEHNGNFNPFCNNTVIKNCKFGPNISAEAIDVKEEVDGARIFKNTFTAKGIVGDSRNDSFIDVKGINTYIYNNTFTVDNAGVNAGVDVIQKKSKKNQKPIKKTGYRVAVFKNTFNLGKNGSKIPIIRFKGGKPFDIHMWNNTRKPNSKEPVLFFSDKITKSCPSWSTVSCKGAKSSTATNTKSITYTLSPNPASELLKISGISSTNIIATIYDIHGKLLLNNVLRRENMSINVSTLLSGTYILTLSGSEINESRLISIK